MTEPSSQQVEQARAQLERALSDLRRATAQAREKTRLTCEEQDELTDKALRGQLGPEMRTLAERVSERRDTWDAVFDGTSPESHLLSAPVAAAAAAYGPAIKSALEGLDPETDDEPGRGVH